MRLERLTRSGGTAVILTPTEFLEIRMLRSGQMAEAEDPTRPDAGSSLPDEVIEVRYWRLSNKVVLICIASVVLILLMAEVIVPKNEQVGRESLPLLCGFCLLFAALGYLFRYMTIIRIDADGVTAERRSHAIRPTTVPWSEIMSCDFMVLRTPRGKVSKVTPVLKDSAGNVLFPSLANLNTAERTDQRRVFLALKSRFRKLDADPWDRS